MLFICSQNQNSDCEYILQIRPRTLSIYLGVLPDTWYLYTSNDSYFSIYSQLLLILFSYYCLSLISDLSSCILLQLCSLTKMSQGLTKTVQSIGRFFVNWSIRLTKYFKHRLLTKRKNILIFGQTNCPLYTHMHSSLSKHWEITRIYTTAPQVPEQSNEPIEPVSTQIEKVDKDEEKPSKPTFYHEYYMDNNYDEIQKILEGKQFDSIVVLPLDHSSETVFNFEDQGIITSYLQQHQQELMRNVFSYRLASKYLTTTGVLILSGSERDFLKAYDEQTRKGIKSYNEGKWYPSTQLIDAQSTYLGVVVGQRDYTDLNSWSVVAMTREWIPQNHSLISKQYCSWASGADLPIPGSFAVFKRKTDQYKSHYLEYI